MRNVYLGYMPTGSKAQPGDFNEALMQVIRAKMGILQFSITDLSRESEIPRATLSRIINNKRIPDMDQMRKMALATKMPMAQLMTAAENILDGKDPF